MKAVMISIRPCWCEQITSGAKTMEVRKRAPKLATPFKCYIYQTKERWAFNLLRKIGFDRFADILERGFGRVIGEFVCDYIRMFDVPYPAYQSKMDKDILDQTQCTYYQLHRYAYHDNLYGWHISQLKIYDKPKALRNFRNPCGEYEKSNPRCGCCDYYHPMGEYPAECACDGAKPLTKPPQSWCYVEEVEDGKAD